MQLLPNLAGTGRRLAEDGCALMDHQRRSRGSHLHLQVLLPCGSQHRATEGSWLSPVTTWCIPCASCRAKIQSCSRAVLAEPAGLGGGSRSASALRRPWQGEFGGSQNRDRGGQAWSAPGRCRGRGEGGWAVPGQSPHGIPALPVGAKLIPPSTCPKESGQVALRHSPGGLGRSPSESALQDNGNIPASRAWLGNLTAQRKAQAPDPLSPLRAIWLRFSSRL